MDKEHRTDPAHRQTDRELKKLEKRIAEEYRQALNGVTAKLDDYLHRFAIKDDIKRKQVQQGTLTAEEYQKWRIGQIAVGQRWQEMVNVLAEDLSHTNQIAMSMVNGYAPEAYALNHNFGTYEAETGSGIDTSYTLYDRQTVERLVKKNPDLLPRPKVNIPKDVKWNKQKINSAILQGILQGESIPQISRRLETVVDMNHRAAVRNARTAVTGAENAGRSDSYKRAKEMGINMKQIWLATLDGRTRHSHRQLDGEAIAVGDKWHHPKFSNGCRYPGDPEGKPAEVYNCRCTLIAQIDGAGQLINGAEGRNTRHMGDMTYDEWKGSHERFGVESGGNEEPATFAGKIQKIRERVVANGGIPAEADLMEAGKIVAGEIKGMYEEQNREIQKIVDQIEKLSKEANRIEKELDDLYAAYVSDKHEKYGFKSDDELQAYMKKINARWAEIADERTALNRKKYQLEEKESKYYASAEKLKNKLSAVRKMGPEGLDINGHLKNTRSKIGSAVKDAYAHYPTDWVEKSVNRNKLSVKKVRRGFYNDYNQEIAISLRTKDDAFETAIHELGHRMEYTIPGLRDIEQAFYDRRTAGEDLTWLGPGYRRNEVSRKDDFLHPYMGKDYGGRAFELVSMGFEMAYTDPLTLAKDPDMEAWIYGILTLL